MNPRKYSDPPFRVAVLHGGPGAHGSVAPVAREASRIAGTLEPMQTETTIDGQVGELRRILENHAELPVTLIGHSWGAWLATIFAARHPEMVRKLILAGCGPFEAHYAERIMPTRLSRLEPDIRERCELLMKQLHDALITDKGSIVAELGEIMGSTDAFEHLPPTPEEEKDALPFHPEGFAEIMAEAQQMRRDGDLLRLAAQVQCPVAAIHGDYDPHPAEGVEKPLSQALKDFRFVLLQRCGHEPWRERYARDAFFAALRREMA